MRERGGSVWFKQGCGCCCRPSRWTKQGMVAAKIQVEPMQESHNLRTEKRALGVQSRQNVGGSCSEREANSGHDGDGRDKAGIMQPREPRRGRVPVY